MLEGSTPRRRFSTVLSTLRLSIGALVLASACVPAVSDGPKDPKPQPTTAPVAKDALDEPLALDPKIKKGTLDNGLTYYVIPHVKPQRRAQIWLAVNAGSVLEDDDQRGLAHFVEHMGFNGTKRFPKEELVAFLEQAGVRFGADLNAYTSFDETVYKLQIPTDKPEFFTKGLSVLRDWADGMSFDAEEVEKERGVVLEEWRLGRGARMRLFDKQAPVIFNGSKYAERITIGKPEIIQKASRETLLRYYQDWYRPDLMAVIAVGDFDAAAVEAQIREEFSSMKSPEKPRARPEVTVPPHAETLVSIETDREMPAVSVAIASQVKHRPEASGRDYRRSVGEQLYGAMINARFDELRRAPNAPFLQAFGGSSGVVRTVDAFRQGALVKEDGIERGLDALLEETSRVERHGFTQTELDRAKTQLLRQFERSAKEADKSDSGEIAAEVVRNFLEDEAMPGRQAELGLVQQFLPTFELAELDAMAKSLAEGSRVITVTGPPTIVKPTPESLLAIEKSVAARTLKPYVDAAPSGPLMATAPKAGTIVKTESIPEVGVTVWTLSNGARVVVKPTDFNNDDVRMTASSPGGTSLVKDAGFTSALFADEVVSEGGLGPFDAVGLRKSLSGKLANVRATIGELEEGLTGSTSSEDLETLLQLTHLSFTAPRKDAEAFASWRLRAVETVKNRRLSPERTFQEELQTFSTQDHPRRRPVTTEVLGAIDLDQSMAFYRDRFADAGDFTFVFVGNVDLAKLQPLVETYLASLPSTQRTETWKDIGVKFPSGAKRKVIEMGSEPKSLVSVTFHGTEKWSRDADNDVTFLGEVLKHRLRQILREDMGGVYGVQVSASLARRPKPAYQFTISFGCAPENVAKLEQAIKDEVKLLQEKGAPEDVVTRIQQLRRRAHETDLKDNSYWLRELDRAYTYGDDPRSIVDEEPMIAKLTSDLAKKSAKKYLRSGDTVVGVLNPVSSKPQ